MFRGIVFWSTNPLSPMNRDKIIADVRAKLGLQNRAPIDWTYEERTAYNKALAAAILADPAAPAAAVETAQTVMNANYAPLDNYSVLQKLEDFTGEVVSQEENLNPFSVQNRGKTAFVIATAIIIGVGVYAWTKGRYSAPVAAK